MTGNRNNDTLPLPVLPEPGDFGLVPTYGNWRNRLAAWLIQFGTDAPVNHAFVYVGDGMIVEAQPGGAQLVRLGYAHDSIVWSTGRVLLTDSQRAGICQTAHEIAAARTPYGWLDLVAIAFAQKRLGEVVDPDAPIAAQPWWVQRIESLRTLICSQLVDVAYEGGGARLFKDHRIPGLVSPGDLWRRLGSPVVAGASR